ncbi:MAG TPA: DNA polymerase III subunit gamma/tau [Planctomycetota bacterium]
MSYRVLARKYRPRTFGEVIGQDHIVRALSRAIEKERVGQAYLLVGPRGVGKTSTARILAKSLNCERGPTVAPCLTCAACTEIERGANVDVVEIDGASNNGVDDVRAIRDRVHYLPLRDRTKIYIVDEVQRLSGPAFDALLKTLEEPPGHALFLFATTDPQKIPDTIVSRCQTFEFRRLREADVRAKMERICVEEGLEVPTDVLVAIARGCRGGMRDAESMLDQLLAVADGAPSLDDLEMIAGLARPERWLTLFESLAVDDGAAVLRSVDDFLQRGGTERDFVEQAIDAVRDLLHVALLGEDALGVEPAPERREQMLALAGQLGRERLESLLGMLFTLDGRMNHAPLAARALLEWTLLRAARLGALIETGALLEALQGGGGSPASAAAPAAAVAPRPTAAPRPKTAAATKAAPRSKTAPKPAASAATATVATATASAPQTVTLETLMTAAERGRPTLGRTLRDHLIEGTVAGAAVDLLLRPPRERDLAMLEDPVELAYLRDLPGSPGPWRIRFAVQTARPPDPIGDRLREAFGGTEETP